MPHQVVNPRVPLGGETVRDRRILFTCQDVQPIDLHNVTGQVRPRLYLWDVAHQIGNAVRMDP